MVFFPFFSLLTCSFFPSFWIDYFWGLLYLHDCFISYTFLCGSRVYDMRFEFITVYPQIILIFTCNAAILQQFISIFPLPSFVQSCQTFNLCIFCKHHNTQALITSKKNFKTKNLLYSPNYLLHPFVWAQVSN